MIQEKTFYSLNNWKLFQTKEVSKDDLLSTQQDLIKQENQKGYVVIFTKKPITDQHITLECYKKHTTAILKSILIGKFPLPVYSKCKAEINEVLEQTKLLEELIQKPEFTKYSIQRKLYFNLD